MNLNLTDRQIAEGRLLLRNLLPQLRQEVSLASPDGVLQPTSLIGQSLMGSIGYEKREERGIRRKEGGGKEEGGMKGMKRGV